MFPFRKLSSKILIFEFLASRGILAVRGGFSPTTWVIFATTWVIFATTWVIFAHEDCPWVIFATRTVRQYTYQHVGPSRGLSVGDFRPRGLSVGDFRLRGLSVGDFRPRGLSVSTHISTLALPVDCPWVIFAHEDCPLVRISARWPFPWTIRG